MSYGYNGKILHVDLTTGNLQVEEPGEAFFRRYLGGSALGTHYALKLIPTGADPLGPAREAGTLRAAVSISSSESVTPARPARAIRSRASTPCW